MSFPSSVAAVINFCSNDYPYLRHCIASVKPLTSQIIIPVCDHFFDGKREDPSLLNRIYAENPTVQFIEFPFENHRSSVYGHNLARLLGSYFLKESITHVLFLDCDEIADTKACDEWFSSSLFHEYEAMRLSTYWYFRESFLQAIQWEETPLLIKKSRLDGELLMNEKERAGMFAKVEGNKKRSCLGLDEKPLFHHYSWVRTKEQLLRKVSSWGHNWERDWTAAIEEEFSREFNGTDFIHGYRFKKVSPHALIDLTQMPAFSNEMHFPHVRRLTQQEVNAIDIALTYHIPLHIEVGGHARSSDLRGDLPSD